MRHGVEQGDVRPWSMAQVERSKLRQLDAPRVDQDQPCAMSMNRGLHLQGEHRVRFGRIAAGYQKNVRLNDVGDGVGHGARAERGGQTGHAAGVSKASAVVDVVRPQDRPGNLLQQVVLLIGAFG